MSTMEVDNIKIDDDFETVKEEKLPSSLYHEIYQSYTEKNYQKCVDLINQEDNVEVEYQILLSACLIHQGTKVN